MRRQRLSSSYELSCSERLGTELFESAPRDGYVAGRLFSDRFHAQASSGTQAVAVSVMSAASRSVKQPEKSRTQCCQQCTLPGVRSRSMPLARRGAIARRLQSADPRVGGTQQAVGSARKRRQAAGHRDQANAFGALLTCPSARRVCARPRTCKYVVACPGWSTHAWERAPPTSVPQRGRCCRRRNTRPRPNAPHCHHRALRQTASVTCAAKKKL